jgi:hypothetical protein
MIAPLPPMLPAQVCGICIRRGTVFRSREAGVLTVVGGLKFGWPNVSEDLAPTIGMVNQRARQHLGGWVAAEVLGRATHSLSAGETARRFLGQTKQVLEGVPPDQGAWNCVYAVVGVGKGTHDPFTAQSYFTTT